ncbi:MAG: hypothetical protein IIA06_07725 [Proteobacteria bacterium]|nr:hypothetical protein [Pseudomonadota bacterium]
MKEKKGKSSLSKDQMIFRGMRKYLDGVRLKDITREKLAFIAEEKAKESSEATANRHMQLIRAVLRKARDEWEWVERVPKVTMFKVRSPSKLSVGPSSADRSPGVLSTVPPARSAATKPAIKNKRSRDVVRTAICASVRVGSPSGPPALASLPALELRDAANQATSGSLIARASEGRQTLGASPMWPLSARERRSRNSLSKTSAPPTGS